MSVFIDLFQYCELRLRAPGIVRLVFVPPIQCRLEDEKEVPFC